MAGERLRQGKVWDVIQGDRELPPGLKEVESFLGALAESDEEICRALVSERGHGRDDYPVLAMWRLMAVQLFLRKGKFSDLLGELRRNADFARLLGFAEQLPGDFRLPNAWVVSRFHAKLQGDEYRARIARLQVKTVELLREADPRIGRHTAQDSTDIRTHGSPARRQGESDREKPATDPEASWSVKTKRWEGADGKKREEKKSTFGYKACLNVDVNQPVILAVQTVTGSTNDQLLAIPVLQRAVEVVGKGILETCAEDKGFDSTENVHEAYKDLGVSLIVPTREVTAQLEEVPAADREIALKESGNVVRDMYSGEVACYASTNGSEPVRRLLKYAGFDRDREAHKFRCPLGMAARSQCQAFDHCSAGLSGNQGRQVRVPLETDIRRFAPIYPRSKKWQRLYRGRSAVERVNSYLKEVLRLEDHCLRGKKAIELRVLLAAVTLNLRTLLAIRASQRRVQAA